MPDPIRPVSLKTKITTPKVAETKAFYVDLFGLEVVEEWDHPDDAGVILGFSDREAEAFLEIYRGETTFDFSGLALQFRIPDAAAFKAFAETRTDVRGPVERPWGTTYLYLTDPNGVAVMAFEGGV
ncbi:MAG: VOC family protein [Maricaulaceae bacterium]|jgi:catechol 2,3-dioxygenase-like lactoylglutathione lyase family enzyme